MKRVLVFLLVLFLFPIQNRMQLLFSPDLHSLLFCIAPGWSEQADLLRAEGAAFKDETHVDLRQSLWLRAD